MTPELIKRTTKSFAAALRTAGVPPERLELACLIFISWLETQPAEALDLFADETQTGEFEKVVTIFSQGWIAGFKCAEHVTQTQIARN